MINKEKSCTFHVVYEINSLLCLVKMVEIASLDFCFLEPILIQCIFFNLCYLGMVMDNYPVAFSFTGR